MTSPIRDHWPEASLSLMWQVRSVRNVKDPPWHPRAILTGEAIMIQ